MISFKEFLIEASTGQAKWDKYFGSENVKTVMKSDAKALDTFGNPTKKELKKGDEITVLAGDYDSKPRIRVGKAEYRVSFAAIDKPFKVGQSITHQLKPDQLGLFGPMFMTDYAKKLKKAIESHKDVPEEHSEYLKALIELAQKPDDTKAQDRAKNLYDIVAANDAAFKATINNDFMEALGPFFVVNEKPEYKAGGCKFPEAGNEPLYDFTMKANGVIDSFSSKRSGGNTNTLKVTEVLKAVQEMTPAQKRKYKKEIELMNIISDNSAKGAPDAINTWLKANFPNYKLVPATKGDVGKIVALERSTVKWINDDSKMDFKPLVQMAVPDLWYVKAKLNNDGTIHVEPLKSGREIETVKFRSKSSPGHISDKLGFQM